VLIESACSVERVEETLDTLIPMLPEMQYFRFNPGKSTQRKLLAFARRETINVLGSVAS
jgi:hypothetical protein